MVKYICPVCGLEQTKYPHPTVECPRCGWAHDTYQHEHHDAKRYINIMSVNEARKAYKEGKKIY